MPTISIFYGITVMVYWMDTGQHNRPHIHVRYAEYEASVDIKTGERLAGDFPRKKLNLLQTWMDLHQDELMANWEAACEGEQTTKIEPLR